MVKIRIKIEVTCKKLTKHYSTMKDNLNMISFQYRKVNIKPVILLMNKICYMNSNCIRSKPQSVNLITSLIIITYWSKTEMSVRKLLFKLTINSKISSSRHQTFSSKSNKSISNK